MTKVRPSVASSEDYRCLSYVILKAAEVQDLGNGLIRVGVPARAISPEEGRVLQELFPNTEREIEAALSKERLLSALADERAVHLTEGLPTQFLRTNGNPYN